MLLPGAPLANPDQRKRFGFDTRSRVVARNIGSYLGEPVFETEEIVAAASSDPQAAGAQPPPAC